MRILAYVPMSALVAVITVLTKLLHKIATNHLHEMTMKLDAILEHLQSIRDDVSYLKGKVDGR